MILQTHHHIQTYFVPHHSVRLSGARLAIGEHAGIVALEGCLENIQTEISEHLKNTRKHTALHIYNTPMHHKDDILNTLKHAKLLEIREHLKTQGKLEKQKRPRFHIIPRSEIQHNFCQCYI